MSTTAPDVDIVAILSSDDAPCEVMESPCGRSAVWAMRCQTCGLDVLACAPCREELDKYLHLLATWRLPTLDCARCSTPWPHPGNWRPI